MTAGTVRLSRSYFIKLLTQFESPCKQLKYDIFKPFFEAYPSFLQTTNLTKTSIKTQSNEEVFEPSLPFLSKLFKISVDSMNLEALNISIEANTVLNKTEERILSSAQGGPVILKHKNFSTNMQYIIKNQREQVSIIYLLSMLSSIPKFSLGEIDSLAVQIPELIAKSIPVIRNNALNFNINSICIPNNYLIKLTRSLGYLRVRDEALIYGALIPSVLSSGLELETFLPLAKLGTFDKDSDIVNHLKNIIVRRLNGILQINIIIKKDENFDEIDQAVKQIRSVINKETDLLENMNVTLEGEKVNKSIEDIINGMKIWHNIDDENIFTSGNLKTEYFSSSYSDLDISEACLLSNKTEFISFIPIFLYKTVSSKEYLENINRISIISVSLRLLYPKIYKSKLSSQQKLTLERKISSLGAISIENKIPEQILRGLRKGLVLDRQRYSINLLDPALPFTIPVVSINDRVAFIINDYKQYFSHSFNQTPDSLLRKKLIKKLNYTVIEIPYWHWEEFRTPHKSREYIQKVRAMANCKSNMINAAMGLE